MRASAKLRNTLAIIALSLAITSGGCSKDHSQIPNEYSLVKDIVAELAQNNDLGDKRLVFSIVTGYRASDLALDLGLCKKQDGCNYFAQLNPFHDYNNPSYKEIIRQSNVYGNVNGYASSNGTIEIPLATFRILEGKKNYLVCTIAHEIAHVIDSHHFKHTKELYELAANKSEEEEEKISNKISRKYELVADAMATEMSVRSGYSKQDCIDSLRFMHEVSGDSGRTDDSSTHPDLAGRIKNLSEKDFSSLDSKVEKYGVGEWAYNKEDNFILYTPQS